MRLKICDKLINPQATEGKLLPGGKGWPVLCKISCKDGFGAGNAKLLSL